MLIKFWTSRCVGVFPVFSGSTVVYPLSDPQVKFLEPNYIQVFMLHSPAGDSPSQVNRPQVHSGDSRPARSKVTGQLIILTFYDTYI